MAPRFRAEAFEDVFDEWEALLPSCSTNTVFVTPAWQRLWWEHFGDGWSLSLLSFRENGRLAGLAPLASKDGVLSFLGGRDLFDYHDFLAPKGHEVQFFEALFDHLSSLEWGTVELHTIPEGSPTLEMVRTHADRLGFSVTVNEEEKAPVMALPTTWDEYLSGLSKKRRHELRRKIRRLEAAGEYAQTNYTTADEVRDALPDFFRLHAASSPDKAEYMTAERKSFFVDMATELADRGTLVLSLLELRGARVAACINFDYLDGYLLYNSGYDPDYSDLSVGLINTALTIKDAIKAGKASFDFLRGTERYKYHLGAEDRSVYLATIRR